MDGGQPSIKTKGTKHVVGGHREFLEKRERMDEIEDAAGWKGVENHMERFERG